jgi:hypothetical protein
MGKLTATVLDLAQRAGKWGIPGVLLLCIRATIDVCRKPGWDTIESGITTWGVGLILVGVLANTKKLKDLSVTTRRRRTLTAR